MIMKFEWDESKAETKFIKHGVSFLEAATAFEDDFSITFPDPDHSAQEDRLILMGHSHRGRLLFVSHTDENNQPRIISAREATRRERKVYENVQR
jgi:uncharacterized DUF497 family protein